MALLVINSVHNKRLPAVSSYFDAMHCDKISSEVLWARCNYFIIITPFIFKKVTDPVLFFYDDVRIRALIFEATFWYQNFCADARLAFDSKYLTPPALY